MTEVAVQIGRDRHLSAVASMPEPSIARPMGVVLTNAGVIHRIGPHRFNVKLARRLARRGFPVLRLDLSGLGDSATPPNGLPYEKQSVADLRAGMDYLAAVSGVREFIVAGICSGARNAWATALADERVAAIWMMDGFFLPTAKTTFHFWARRASHEGWWPMVRRLLHSKRDRSAIGRDSRDQTHYQRGFISDLARLVRRGVRPCFAYSGSTLRRYSYESQLNDRIAGRVPDGAVEVHFVPSVDHTLTTLDGQQLVATKFEEWCLDLGSRPVPAESPAAR